MKNPKHWVVLLSAACIAYAGFALWRAWIVLQEGSLFGTLFAVAIAIIPVLGVLLVIREIRFGMVMQQMGRQLALEGGLPLDDLPREPSGRIQRAAAQARFDEVSASADLNQWRDWYLIGIAYEDARDRKRARAAMRTAEKLFRSPPSMH